MRPPTSKQKKKSGGQPGVYVRTYACIQIEISMNILLTRTGDEVEQSWLSLYAVKRDLTSENKDRLKVLCVPK